MTPSCYCWRTLLVRFDRLFLFRCLFVRPFLRFRSESLIHRRFLQYSSKLKLLLASTSFFCSSKFSATVFYSRIENGGEKESIDAIQYSNDTCSVTLDDRRTIVLQCRLFASRKTSEARHTSLITNKTRRCSREIFNGVFVSPRENLSVLASVSFRFC